MLMKTATFSLAAAALAFAPAVSAEDAPRTGVSYADLDLSTEEGAAELDRRIDAAARQVCGMDETTLGTRITSRESRQCYRNAKRQIERQLADLKRNANYGG